MASEVSSSQFLPSAETLALQEYIDKKGDGEELSYLKVKQDLDIDIRSPTGRGKLYSALRRLGRQCKCKPGFGYILSTKDTAKDIVDGKKERIVSTTKIMVRAADDVLERHEDEMTAKDVSAVKKDRVVGKTIVGIARNNKMLIQKELVKLTEANPVV